MADQIDIDYTTETVAAFLGTDWTVEPKADEDSWSRNNRTLTGPEGESLIIRVFWKDKSRVIVLGALTPHCAGVSAYGIGSSEITVAASRGPKVIAAEISRRLLPDYRERLKVWRERVDSHNAYESDTERSNRALAALLGKNETRGRIYWSPSGDGYGHLEGRGNRVDIDLKGIPLPLAIEITKVLRDYK